MIISPYNKLSPFGTSLNEAGIPLPNNTLFHLDGSISGSEFVDISGNGKNFTITNKDFTTFYFPYKSAATISAPSGDLALFTALGGANSFWYGANEDSPNEIPIVSFFPNIDYGNQFFNRHVPQTVDGNGVETQEPYVIDIVAYDAALTGSDLTTANSYYSVPTEITSGVKWVTKDGDDANDGSKGSPWLTMQKAVDSAVNGDTIYIKSGVYSENHTNGGVYIVLRYVNLMGIGRVELDPIGAGTQGALYINSAGGISTVEGIYCKNTKPGIKLRRSHSHVIERCYFDTNNGASVYGLAAANDAGADYKINNSVILGSVVSVANMELDSCMVDNYAASPDNTINPSAGATDFKLTNCKLDCYDGRIIRNYAAGTGITLKGCDTSAHIWFQNDPLATSLNITYCTLRVTDANNLIGLATGSVTADIHNNTIIDEATGLGGVCTILDVRGTHDVDFYDNSLTTIRSVNINSGDGVDDNLLNIYDNTIEATGVDTYVSISPVGHSCSIHDNILIAASYISISSGTGDQTAINLAVYNNHLYGTSNVTVAAGDLDGTGNNYASCAIYNNYIDSDSVYGGGHCIFIKDVRNAITYHNYIKNQGFGIVYKGFGETWTGAAWSNLVEGCNTAITNKGVSDAQYYGNTIKDSVSNGFAIARNDDVDDWPSDDVIFKNNIIDTTQGKGITITANINDFISNYNVIYSTDEVANVAGVEKTWDEWQDDLGYDANSVNLDPLLTKLIPGANSPAIGAGDTLDAAYDDGLDTSTDWGDSANVPSVVTKVQSDDWDCGAYVR